MALKPGFIGLGIMGTPMVGHLIHGGHALYPHRRGTAWGHSGMARALKKLSSLEIGQKARSPSAVNRPPEEAPR